METARKTKPQKLCDPATEIFNSKTKKCVKRTGAVGKSILARYKELDDARETKYRTANPTDADAEYRVKYSLCTTDHPIKCRTAPPTKKELEFIIEKDVRPYFLSSLEDDRFKVVKMEADGVVVYRVGGRSHVDLGIQLFNEPDADGNFPFGKYLFNAEVLGSRLLRGSGSRKPKDEDVSDVECPSGKILNPETNRCVLKSGAIGKRILASHQKEKTGHADKKRTALRVFDADSDDTDEDCMPQTRAKYVNRNGPPYEGNWPGCHNKYRTGNDGELYQSRANSKNIFSWKKA